MHSWLLCVARGNGRMRGEGAGRPAAGGAQRSRGPRRRGEPEAARGQRGTKRTAPESLALPEGVAEDKAWLTQRAVELRRGLQQAATATALLEDSLK